MFSRFFIHRPIFASVIALLTILLGGISVLSLPVENTPDITPPTVQISSVYPGANARVIAETVTRPIEEEVNGVEGMIYISSKSSDDGSSTITVTFEVGTDIDMATVLVQNRVAIAEPKLPEEVKRQGVVTKKQSTSMVMMVNLISPDDSRDSLFLSNYATTRIRDGLLRIKGVGDVQVMGARDFSMRVWLDPTLMAARELTVNEIVAALKEQNVQVAAGQIGQPPTAPGQEFQYTISTQGRLSEAEAFDGIIIKTGENGQLVYLRDVARLERGAENYNWNVRLNKKESIALAIYQLPGANALSIAEAITQRMDELSASFPRGMEYRVPYNTTLFIDASISEVVVTLCIAVILVILTVYIFLQDWRTSIIPTLTIPVSLIGTFAVMLLTGMSINTLSLFGLVLAIGIVVDDAIVVVENTMRLIDEEGLSSKDAATKAMEQVTGPVVATTLVLLAVFVPTAMMGGITGRLYQQFAMTISIATIFSSINALTLSPAMCGLLLRPTPTKRNFIFRGFNSVLDVSTSVYLRVVRKAARVLILMLLIFGGLIYCLYYGFQTVPTGFVPNEDQGYFFVVCKLPDAAALGRTTEVQERIEEVTTNTPGVQDVIAIDGYSFIEGVLIPNAGSQIVILDPWDERTTPELKLGAIMANVSAQCADIQEAQVIAFPPPAISGLGSASGFEFQLQDRGGIGLNNLQTFAEDIVAAGTDDPVLIGMNSGFRAAVPQVYVDVNRTKVKTLDIPLDSVFGALQAYLGSAYVNDFEAFGRSYKVMVQADQHFRNRIEDIGRIQVRNRSGAMIPLSSFITVTDSVGPQTIYRYNLYPSSRIGGDSATGFSSGEAINAVEAIAAEKLPDTMGYEWSGITFQQIESGDTAAVIFSLAIMVVFLVLAAQYESWSIPIAILMFVPLGLLGGILPSLILGTDNNIYTQIGFVLLIGLAAKTAILIVEFAKQIHEEEGLPVRESAIKAAHLRFRPILMTAFSFILGVAPLVIATGAGAMSRRSLGTAVFGGSLFSTVVGIFLIPIFYILIQGTSEWVRGVKPNAKTVADNSSPQDAHNEMKKTPPSTSPSDAPKPGDNPAP